MKHLIFSKQCDHDLDLAPFWHHYYANVFRADLIVITPVKTRLSEISATCEFYRARNIPVFPIELENWSDAEVWRRQLAIIGPYVATLGAQFTALSADTDQYFQPLDESVQTPDVVFRRHFVYSDHTPTIENITTLNAVIEPTYDLVAGFVNTLENPRVGLTGHFHGLTPRTLIRRELHFSFRGSKQFEQKVRALAVVQDGAADAAHWKTWKAAADAGATELAHIASQFFSPQAASESTQSEILREFAATVTGRGRSIESRSSCPFASQLLRNPFQVTTPQGVRVHELTFPLNELDHLKELFASGRYMLPEGISPNRVLDIGANIGGFSALMKFQNPSAQITAFELNSDTANLYLANFGSDPLVQLRGGAVSDAPGRRGWFRDPFSSTNDSLTQGTTRVRATGEVDLIDIAQFDGIYSGEPLDVVKISVNGTSIELLRNSEELLQRTRCLFVSYQSSEERAAVLALPLRLRAHSDREPTRSPSNTSPPSGVLAFVAG